MPSLDSLEKIINHRLTLLVSVSALVVAIVANFVGTNALATKGFAVSESESKILLIEKQNRNLRVNIEEKSNLQGMSAQAEYRGFISASNIVFVPTPPTTALR